MNILVLSSACRASGALTIYRQFLSHLPKYVEDNKYYIYIDPSMDQPTIENVEYIYDSDHSYKHRMFMDKQGYMEEMKRRNVKIDIVFSLQNTGCVTDCIQVIYYHQPMPFYPHIWNPFKKSERLMFLYKYIYPTFVKRTLSDNTHVIVQIPFIKKGFSNCFNFENERIHIAFPDIENIDIDKVPIYNFDNNCFNFIYPASPSPYKGHLTIAKALSKLKQINETLLKRIRIHLTIAPQENVALFRYISKNKLTDYFVFHGRISHNQLLSYYKSSVGLLFPSTIETLGLPLLEAASFGLPIIAADLDYAHEVLGNYDGVKFVGTNEIDRWSTFITEISLKQPRYIPLIKENSGWDKVFSILLEMDKTQITKNLY